PSRGQDASRASPPAGYRRYVWGSGRYPSQPGDLAHQDVADDLDQQQRHEWREIQHAGAREHAPDWRQDRLGDLDQQAEDGLRPTDTEPAQQGADDDRPREHGGEDADELDQYGDWANQCENHSLMP